MEQTGAPDCGRPYFFCHGRPGRFCATFLSNTSKELSVSKNILYISDVE